MRWAWMLGLMLYLHAPLTVRACRCVKRYASFADEAADAGLIFSGRVVARRQVEGTPFGRLRFELLPGTVWQGSTAARFVIYSNQTNCGVDFKLNEEYFFVVPRYPGFRPDSRLVGRCSGYHEPLQQARVLGLVKAMFVPTLRANLGAEGPRLNTSEAEYFAGILPGKGFDFANQLVGFFVDRHRITKQLYVDRYLTQDVANQLVLFTPQEKVAAGGYVAAVVSWRKKPVSPAFRRRLVRQLAKA